MPDYLKWPISNILDIFLKDFWLYEKNSIFVMQMRSHIISIQGLKMPSSIETEVRSGEYSGGFFIYGKVKN